MTQNIQFSAESKRPAKTERLVFIGRQRRLKDDEVRSLVPKAHRGAYDALVDDCKATVNTKSASTRLLSGGVKELAVGVLPESCSRYNTPTRAHSITSLIGQLAKSGKSTAVVIAFDTASQTLAVAAAVARAFPLFDAKTKTGDTTHKKTLKVVLLPAKGTADASLAERISDGVRFAQRLVDTPPNILHTDAFIAEARAVAERNPGVTMTVIEGDALKEGGFGGLLGVGQAATHPPALVQLSWTPKRAKQTIAWVGKGIVYDTGGLSIKGKGGMVGMKMDMGGAAAVLAGFEAAVRGGVKQRLHALLCLAENSVGPDATRPDDVITLYSGKTVEVNNTDAEGRLVLGDGVAYAVKDLKADTIVDMATLTGAQLVATGRRHAAIVSNSDKLEAEAVKAGRTSGDLTHPLPYCPEWYRSEFTSKVADMKNSVKDRMNAQTSCAGQFVANHLGDFDGKWLHVDIAGPAFVGGRGTGFGVALLVELFTR